MRPSWPRLLTILAALALAGCATPASTVPSPAPAASNEIRVGSELLHSGGVQGGLSLLHLAEGGDAHVTFPAGVLVLNEKGQLVPAKDAVTIHRGGLVQYLPPYGATNLTIQVDGQAQPIVLSPGHAIADGGVVVDLLKLQRAQFPHRTPGMPNYEKSIDYFATYFKSLGYDVEVFKTPLPPTQIPLSDKPSTQSVESVVATKRGTTQPDRYLAFGGHFDVVEGTTEGAFDNTGGTMSVLALAQAFAHVNTSRSLIFAAWGGEEDGILGSDAWLAAHPDMAPKIDLYINYDVSGLSWPAPLSDPAPIVASAGPDGPIGDSVTTAHQTIMKDWMQLDAPFVYQPIAMGQATGAGVNAQSDHTSFMTRGVPVLFQFTSKVPDAFAIIHSERDTLDNLTKYALKGVQGMDAELNATERAQGEAVLAKSFEVQMMTGFYLVVLTDDGVISDARPGPTLSALPPPS